MKAMTKVVKKQQQQLILVDADQQQQRPIDDAIPTHLIEYSSRRHQQLRIGGLEQRRSITDDYIARFMPIYNYYRHLYCDSN